MWFTAAYTALVILGTLNREMTGLLLVLIWFALARDWRRGLLFVTMAVLTYGLVRLMVGERPVELTLIQTFQENIHSWRTVPAILKNLAFVPLWAAVVIHYRRAPVDYQRLVWVAVIYLLSFLAGAMWQEVRLLLPAVILVLPVAVRTI